MKETKRKQKKEVSWRHRVWFSIFRFTLKPFFVPSYRYKYKKYKQFNDQPYLILGNHSIAIDPMMIALSFNIPLYYVSTEQIFNLGWKSKLLKRVVNPISKSKSLSDIQTIKKIKRIVDQGGSIGMFPEGNVPYTGENPRIPEALGKLIKNLNIPIIIFNFHGLYQSNPRWSIYRKYGQTFGELTRVIMPGEYQEMTADEIMTMIKDELYVNCYEDQAKNPIPFIGEKIAEGLERLIFVCPKCHSPHVMETKDDKIYCNNCDFVGTYDQYGYLNSEDFGKQTLIELDKKVKEIWLNHLINHQEENLYIDEAEMEITYPGKKVPKGNVTIKTSIHGITISGIHETGFYPYEELVSLAIQGKHKILLYFVDQPTIMLSFDNRVSPYKYLLTFQFYKYKANALKKGNSDDIIELCNLGL